MIGVERNTNYEFKSGEKILVKQKVLAVNKENAKIVLDVEFDGSIPAIKDVSIMPLI
jgi:hypothetical protein